VSLDELMDVASEPHEFNVFLATNFSALTQSIADRLSDVVCNSKPKQSHSNLILLCDRLNRPQYGYCRFVCLSVAYLAFQ